jgi:hypothetical protein
MRKEKLTRYFLFISNGNLCLMNLRYRSWMLEQLGTFEGKVLDRHQMTMREELLFLIETKLLSILDITQFIIIWLLIENVNGKRTKMNKLYIQEK